MIQLAVWQQHCNPVEQRLQELVRWMEGRGFRVEIGKWPSAEYVFFACHGGPEASASAWTPILRSQFAAAMAEVIVGPLTTRWLSRFLAMEARARNYPLTIGVRGRALQMARQFVEAPPSEPGLGGNLGTPASVAPAVGTSAVGTTDIGTSGAGVSTDGHGARAQAPVLTTNLLRWQARLARLLLEAFTAHPRGVVVEAIAYFRSPSYIGALRRAAAATIAELATEREEQRASVPWRSLWLGPPPRAYEVHLFRAPNGVYHLLDRWGAPAGRRWLGDGVREAATEEVVVGHLVRLGPRRIVVHLPDEAPVQAAVRAAFPGRVHTCHGCPRCMPTRRSSQVPTPSR